MIVKQSIFKRILWLLVIEAITLVLYLSFDCYYDLHTHIIKQIEKMNNGSISLPNGVYTQDSYFGNFLDTATFRFKSGTTYEGYWDNYKMEGQGVLKVPNEGKYEGSFVNSIKSGSGTFIWEDGTIYVGNWKNDQMDGQGVYTIPNGEEYSGLFEANKFKSGNYRFSNSDGKYVIKYVDFEIRSISITFSDGTTYNGESNGKTIAGKGTMVFANKDKYTGSFSSGTRNGDGLYTWSNGDKYDGAWSNDKMSGYGLYTYVSGNWAKGTFNNGTFYSGSFMVSNSLGSYTFTYGSGTMTSVSFALKDGTKCFSGIESGQLTGVAEISYSNGDKYNGKVNNGSKNGLGVYTWKSGAAYDGNWSSDKMNGTGTYFYPSSANGYKLVGNFVKGFPNGECRYYVNATTSYKTDWINGKCVKIYE